jgi:FixJ family two-component response regulator
LGADRMAMADFTIFLIDDDPRVLKALTRLLQSAGYKTKPYSSSKTFLGEHDASIPGCAVLDLSMSGLNGLDVQHALTRQGVDRPIIFLTGRGTIRATVQAMKAGAIDVLLKPIDRRELLQAVKRAQEEDKMRRDIDAECRAVRAFFEELTPREREVLTYVIAGLRNKQIAATLGTVEKTIKVHRGRVMGKMRVRSVAELVRMTEKLSWQSGEIMNSIALKANSTNGFILKQ